MARKVVTAAITGLLVFVVGPALFERLAPRPWVIAYQRAYMVLYRPLAGVMPGWAVVETIGRRTGQPRQTPVGGRLCRDTFWLVVGERSRSQYVKNIEANPKVRVRAHGRWRTGTAHVLVHENARRRLITMNPINSVFIWIAGTDLATIRVDLDPAPAAPNSRPRVPLITGEQGVVFPRRDRGHACGVSDRRRAGRAYGDRQRATRLRRGG